MRHIDWTAPDQRLCAIPANKTQLQELLLIRDADWEHIQNLHTHYLWIKDQLKNETRPGIREYHGMSGNAAVKDMVIRLDELRTIDTYLRVMGQWTHNTENAEITKIEKDITYSEYRKYFNVTRPKIAEQLFREISVEEAMSMESKKGTPEYCTPVMKPKRARPSKSGVYQKYVSSNSKPIISQPPGKDSTIAHEKSVFRPAYGVNFKYSGKIIHGITHYMVAVAVHLPNMTNWNWGSNGVRFNCSKGNMEITNSLTVERCRDLNNVLQYSDERIRDASLKTQTILMYNIPSMLARNVDEENIPVRPGPLQTVNTITPDIDSKAFYSKESFSKPGKKNPVPAAQIAAAASLAVQAIKVAPQAGKIVNSVLDVGKWTFKAFQEVRKGNLFHRLAEYAKLPGRNRDRINAIQKGLAALVRRDTQSFRMVSHNLLQLRLMTNRLMREANMLRLRETHMALATKRLTAAESILGDARMLEAGVQQIINGHLSPHILPPWEFENIMSFVRRDLQSHYPDYKPALPKVGQYYQMDITKWKYANNTLMMIIPIMIRHRLENPMDLYRLQVIPMPYFSNPSRPKEKDGRVAYTKLDLEHDMMVMDEFRNAPYRSEDLADCLKLDGVYYCNELHLIYISTIPNCAASIYHNGDPELIAKHCPFKYFHRMVPEPVMLDGGNEILIAGTTDQWTMMCEDSLEIPKYLKSKPYVIVKRKELCQCKLISGEFFLQENLATCRANYDMKHKGPIVLYYTLNAAVAGAFGGNSTALTKSLGGRLKYLSEKGITESVRGDMMSKIPYDLEITEVKVQDGDNQYNEETLVDSYSATEPVPLLDVIGATVEDREMCMTETDVVDKKQDPAYWFKGGNHLMAFVLVLASFGAAASVVYCLSVQQWCNVMSRIKTMGRAVREHGNLLMKLTALGVLPQTEARGYSSTVIFEFNMITVATLIVAQVAVIVIISVLWWMTKKIVTYASSDYTESPLTMVKRTWVCQMLDSRNTDLVMQISSVNLGKSKQIYITTVPGHPTLFSLEGRLTASIISRRHHWYGDVLCIPWREAQLYFEDRLVEPPEVVRTWIFVRTAIDTILRQSDCRVQFLLLHNHEYVVLEQKDTSPIFKRVTRDHPLGPIRRKRTESLRGPVSMEDPTMTTRISKPPVKSATLSPSAPPIITEQPMASTSVSTISGAGEQIYESFEARPKGVYSKPTSGKPSSKAMRALAKHLKILDSPEPAESTIEMERF